MSDQKSQIKNMNQFYRFGLVYSQSRVLQDLEYTKIEEIVQHDSTYYVQIKYLNNNRSIFMIKEEGEQIEITQVPIHDTSIQGKIFFVDKDQSFILYKTLSKLHFLNLQTNEMKQYNINPDFHVPLPLMNASLFMSNTKDLQAFLHSNQTVIPAGTLQRILQPYAMLSQVTSLISDDNSTLFAVSAYLQQFNQYHILVITLIENQGNQHGPKYQYKLLDLYKMKPESKVNKMAFVESGEQMLIVYNGSKLKKFTVNKQGTDMNLYRRLEKKISHNFNLYQVRKLVLLENKKDIALQVKSGGIYIVRGDSDFNLLYNDDEGQRQQLLCFTDKVLMMSQDKYDKTQLRISGLFKMKINDTIKMLIEEKNEILTALQLMRETGEGKQTYMLYKLEQTQYNDVDLLKQFLEEKIESSDIIYDILRTKDITSLKAVSLLLNKGIEMAQNDNEPDRIMTLIKASKRLKLMESLQIEISSKIKLRDYLFSYSISEILSKFSAQFNDPSEAIQQIFSQLQDEIIEDYIDCMKNLPLEVIDPKFILDYLPPGYTTKLPKFWQRFQQLSSDSETFTQILTNHQIYQSIAIEYIYQLNQPGKALRILQEAAQNRQIDKLTKIAMQAVEHSLIDDVDNMTDHEKKISDLFGIDFSLNESVKAIEGYFSYAKWIFTMDQKLYKRYLYDIKYFLVELIGVDQSPMLSYILDKHGQHSLLFLVNNFDQQLYVQRDQDLAQLVIDIIYEKLSTENLDQVKDYQSKLSHLTLSQHQSDFIKDYLQVHIMIQEEIAQPYGLLIQFRDLLKLQMNSQTDLYIDEVRILCVQMITNVIQKSKGVKEQVLAFSRSKTIGQIDQKWANLLENLIRFRGMLGYSEEQIDVYQIFLAKLLDAKVLSSIEALIKSNIIPMEDIQMSVLKYLQEQFNQCPSEQFYQFFQNSKSFIELLIEQDTSEIHLKKLEQENTLLDAALYLKQNNLLLHEIPLTQIRADFLQNRLIDRILLVHGFSEYPSQFSILLELQQILDDTKQNELIVKVLKHFNTLKYFESAERFPSYLPNMLYELILLRKSESLGDPQWIFDLSPILFKIAQYCSSSTNVDLLQLKKDILKFMQKHMNKQDDLYYEVCRTLITIMKEVKNTKETFDIISDLKSTLDQGMVKKATFLINKYRRTVLNDKFDNDKVFIQILSQGELKYFYIKQIAEILDLEDDLMSKLKVLKGLPCYEIVDALQNDQVFQQYADNQKNKKDSDIIYPKQNQQPDIQLGQERDQELSIEMDSFTQIIQSANDEDQVNLLLDMNYMSEWNETFDLTKFIEDMKSHHVQNLPISVIDCILAKLDLPSDVFPLEELKSLSSSTFLNPLIILNDQLQQSASQESHHQFLNRHLQSIFIAENNNSTTNQLLHEFIRVASDTNYIQVMSVLDDIKVDEGSASNRYSVLWSIALYSNKLKVFAENYWSIKMLSGEQIESLFYQMVEKDLISEIIDDYGILNEVNRQFKEYFTQLNQEMDDENIKRIMIQ